MATVVEKFYDEKGIVWPKAVAPFEIHLIQIGDSPQVKKTADKLYQDLQKAKKEVLYDDRKDKSAGEKFAEADLIGIPLRVVASERTLEKNCAELKERSQAQMKLVKITQVLKHV